MPAANTAISFVIPAFNEEDHIAITINSILDGQLEQDYEIIVVDHNSSDKTAEIAKQLGAKVITKKGGTVAGVRNTGIEHSSGELIVFLDADVMLDEPWFAEFPAAFKQLAAEPMIITGSHCHAPEHGNWIERYWFNNYVHEINTNNLGTGHMITSRKLFNIINGFDDSLATGEDYSFCMNAIKAGARIINNPQLHVIHRDYPENLWQFVRREAWHGTGDVTSIKKISQSKVAIAALLFLSMHIAILFIFTISFVPNNLAILPLAAIVALLLYSSISKFKHCSSLVILINSVIFYFYFTGRVFSFIKALTKR